MFWFSQNLLKKKPVLESSFLIRLKKKEGKVVAAGPGKVENGTKIDMSVKEGDVVLYGKYSGTEITLDGEEYLIMRESDILGIVS